MILLDPDLDENPAPQTSPSRRLRASAEAKFAPETRIPSRRALALFLREAQAAARLRGQVTVLLTTDKSIRSLNRKFRGKNKATDVLSFPAGVSTAVKIAGDVAISVPTARRQAAERGHTLATEIKVLMLHGLLHLAGYDHETDRGEMARREQKLRAKLRLPSGLIERAGDATEVAAAAGKPRAARGARR